MDVEGHVPLVLATDPHHPRSAVEAGNQLAMLHDELEKVKQQLAAVHALEDRVSPSTGTHCNAWIRICSSHVICCK